MAFKPVSPQVNFPQLEQDILKYWQQNDIERKYREKNNNSQKKFSFLDGPITANNPMGVHHAWGRTYKDLWQRFYTMRGYAGRYQNGFDCQGLWVEVEVEKELGFKNKKDIESFGIANFVNRCKERVYKYAGIQTQQSQRLGMFMDWDNSYFTMSDENNYSIWKFLKQCWQRGWIYKGQDSVPWCPRCETAISQHEILTEDYKELTHDSITFQLPIKNTKNQYLLVWTTTPWTLPANIAVAVDVKLDYSLVKDSASTEYWIATEAVDRVFGKKTRRIIKTVKGKALVGLKYDGPFDDLPAPAEVAAKNPDKFHTVVPTDKLIMPISAAEGTGLVHTAVSAGEEDFKLGKKLGLPMIPVIADNADYLPGLGQFTGQNAKNNPHIILDYLLSRDQSGQHWVFDISPYTHRYPACWRCKTELVWKVAEEWYIAMDRPDPTDSKKRSYRRQMVDLVKKIKWLPDFGLDRELDWLKNMHDWLISKKNRYWGLALPIYECSQCGTFEIIGSKGELQKRATSGWDQFVGQSPHRPWIDQVKISCSGCAQEISRVLDVGNPWLDAGIVSVSTLPEDWFPADFITESFPGQFKNWFYSLIAMATVLKKSPPFKKVLGFASLLDEKGQVMHKSSGNMIEFNQGADEIGVDVMRWIYASQNPENNLLFGYKKADEVRRRFLLMLWNVYNFFITYATLDNFEIPLSKKTTSSNILDNWINLRLKQTISLVTKSLGDYDAASATRAIEEFVSDLSLWFVRRSRDRVGPVSFDLSDKNNAHYTLFTCLVNLSLIMAPITPFITDVIYQNLTGLESVHLSEWPELSKITTPDIKIIENMKLTRKIVELGLSARKQSAIKVRQPLVKLIVYSSHRPLDEKYIQLIKDELNVKNVIWQDKSIELEVVLDTKLNSELIAEGQLRELIRQVQDARKAAGARLDQQIVLTAPLPDDPSHLKELMHKTLAQKAIQGESIKIELQ